MYQTPTNGLPSANNLARPLPITTDAPSSGTKSAKVCSVAATSISLVSLIPTNNYRTRRKIHSYLNTISYIKIETMSKLRILYRTSGKIVFCSCSLLKTLPNDAKCLSKINLICESRKENTFNSRGKI